MTTYISILRGINVGGHRSIKMDALRELFSELDCRNVQTYIQSGNIIFQYKKTDQSLLEQKITNAIKEKFDFIVPTIVLNLTELELLIKNNHFLTEKGKDLAYLHVTFLNDHPKEEYIEKIKFENFEDEECQLIGKAVYLFCPNKYSKSKFTNSFFESKLKVISTTRNWKTVNEIYNLAIKVEKM